MTEHREPSLHLPVAPSLPLTHVLTPWVVTPLRTGLPFQSSLVLGVGFMAADYSQQHSKALLSPSSWGWLEQAAWGGGAPLLLHG